MLAILAAAAALRLWGIGFGLPHEFSRPDEDAAQGIALRAFTGDLNPHFLDWPTFFMYVLALAYAVCFQAGRLVGVFSSATSFVVAASTDPTLVRLIARGLSASAGVATVWIVRQIGTRLFDATTGLVASLYLALAALHVRDSHFGVTDISATCLLTLSFFFVVKATTTGAWRHLVLSAAFAGLAASTKYNAGLILLATAWAVAAGAVPSLVSWAARARALAVCAGVAFIVFVAGSPYAALEFRGFLGALTQLSTRLRAGHTGLTDPAWQVHLFTSLRYGLGEPLLVAGIAGLGWFVRARPIHGLLLLVFPLTYFVLIGSGRTSFARYILPVVPFLCLSAAYATTELGRWLGRRTQASWVPAITWALAAVLVLPSAWSAVQSDRLLSRTDTRLLAADWIAGRLESARIFQTGFIYVQVKMRTARAADLARYPELHLDAAGAIVNATGRPEPLPDVVVVPMCPLVYCHVPEAAAALLDERYRLEHIVRGVNPRPGRPVYDRDDAFLLPLSGFSAIERPGPTIAIYVRQDLAR